MEHRKNEHSLIFKGFARFWCQTQDIISIKESQSFCLDWNRDYVTAIILVLQFIFQG